MENLNLGKIMHGFANDNDGTDLFLHIPSGLLFALMSEDMEPMRVELVKYYGSAAPSAAEKAAAIADIEAYYHAELGR